MQDCASTPGPTRILLHGLPGIGKTALAATWLAGHKAPQGSASLIATLNAADGHPVTVHDVLGQWLRELGVAPEHVPPSLVQRSNAFRQRTHDTPVVVLIDNASRAADVRPLIPSGDSSTVVVTSPLRLGDLVRDGFALYPLAELPVSDAAALLATYRDQAVPTDDSSGWHDLAIHCGGHPLTLCVAAAFLATHRHTSPADLAAALGRRPADTLTVGGPCLGDLLTVVYDNLPARARQLYRLLSDYPGPDCTVAVLAAALDQSLTAVEDAMNDLFQAHLVTETGPGRYALGTSVSQHAQRLRNEVDSPDLRDEQLRRLITWYLHRCAGAANTIKPSPHRYTPVFTDGRADRHRHPSPAHAQAWFQIERRNIMAALDTAAELDFDDLLVQLAEAVWDPLRTGYHLEDIVLSQTKASRSAVMVSTALSAVIIARVAFALTSLGEEPEASITTAGEAVQLAHGTDDSWAKAMALSTRARALTAAGHLDDAITDLNAALVLDRQRGDLPSIALRLRRLGQAHQSRGDTARAVELLLQAVDQMAAANDQAGHARSLTYLANGYLAAGRPGLALDALRRGHGYVANAGASRHRVDAELTAARAYEQLGDLAAARALCDELLILLDGQSGSRAEQCRAEVRAMQDQLE
ncbi:hypothetical protein ACIA5G_39740 [Amycolatopsis sp. NPDC051758]|uniref:hypothetical protein n=1 Tax=Amycolatopsis sp. NPDC051758 TaxID=3363935 RepID=UPI0037A0BB65